MPNVSNHIQAEEIAHEIIMQFQEDAYSFSETNFTNVLLETLEYELRPILVKGAEKWLDKNAT